jgi:hypothetical protein
MDGRKHYASRSVRPRDRDDLLRVKGPAICPAKPNWLGHAATDAEVRRAEVLFNSKNGISGCDIQTPIRERAPWCIRPSRKDVHNHFKKGAPDCEAEFRVARIRRTVGGPGERQARLVLGRFPL